MLLSALGVLQRHTEEETIRKEAESRGAGEIQNTFFLTVSIAINLLTYGENQLSLLRGVKIHLIYGFRKIFISNQLFLSGTTLIYRGRDQIISDKSNSASDAQMRAVCAAAAFE